MRWIPRPSRQRVRARQAGACFCLVVLGGALQAWVLSCAPAEAAPLADDCGFRFVEVAAESGVRFHHETGATGELHLPETMGAGVAWVDFDGDGWLDIYLVQSDRFPPDGGEPSTDRLFRNLGPGRDGAIRFVPADAPDLARGYGQGVVAADVDGDRDVDLLVSRYGSTVLLRNDGAGGFAAASPLAPAVPAAGRTGLRASVGGRSDAPPAETEARLWGSSMALADGDGDGDLDLHVSRYLDYDPNHGLECRREGPDSPPETCDPSLFPGQPDRYWTNDGGGRFVDSTRAAGLAVADGRGLGVLFVDLDGDHLPDIYVANDLDPNHLFRNRGDGTFEDVSLLSGAAVNRNGRPEAGMGLLAADLDRDGDPDLLVTNFDVETNTHYRNDTATSGMLFEDVSATSGFGLPSFNLLGFGLVAEDLDRNGMLDVYVANGHIFAVPRRDNTTHRQRDLLLRGDGAGRLAEVRCAWTDDDPLVSRAVAAADHDNDGDGDLLVTANGGPARLWRNDTPLPPETEWLGVELRGRSPNTQAVGAVVSLTDAPGQPPRRRFILRGDGYQSSSGHRLRWALPAAATGEASSVSGPAAGARLDLRWPDGRRTRILAPPTGAYLVIEERP